MLFRKNISRNNQLLIFKKNLIKFKCLLHSKINNKQKTFNKYRIINKDLFFFKTNGEIIGMDKTNFCSNFLILIKFKNNCYSYFPASNNINQIIFFQNFIKNYKIGNITILKFLLPQEMFHNLFSSYMQKTTYAKAGGSYCTFISHLNEKSLIKLPSKKYVYFQNNLKLIVGQCSNVFHKFEKFGKAGYKKFFFLKPIVRGTAKNAVDHPHGGRTSLGRPQKNP